MQLEDSLQTQCHTRKFSQSKPYLFPVARKANGGPEPEDVRAGRVSGSHPVHLFFLLLEKLRPGRVRRIAPRLHKELKIPLWVGDALSWHQSQQAEPCPGHCKKVLAVCLIDRMGWSAQWGSLPSGWPMTRRVGHTPIDDFLLRPLGCLLEIHLRRKLKMSLVSSLQPCPTPVPKPLFSRIKMVRWSSCCAHDIQESKWQ